MKTTIDLPDGLVREIKIRAVHEGRRFKELVADLLRRGLDAPESARQERTDSRVTRDTRTGLPVIVCRRPARADQRLTPERVADILIEQEASWQDEAAR